MEYEVMGIKYTLVKVISQDSMFNDENVAECDYSERVIRLCLNDKRGVPHSKGWLQDSSLHELAHIFLYETGQSDINDERSAEVLSKFARFAKNIEYK